MGNQKGRFKNLPRAQIGHAEARSRKARSGRQRPRTGCRRRHHRHGQRGNRRCGQASYRARVAPSIGSYRDPLGGRPLVLVLPTLGRGAARTPFQRDLSPTHAKRLAEKIDETAAFLDPLIVVRGEDGRFWTPNGRHRLAAAKVLGLKQITALISPDETLAYRHSLPFNTEKAPQPARTAASRVIRMARSLSRSAIPHPRRSATPRTF